MVYPVGDERYIFIMNELDSSENVRENATQKKVSTIQNTYLFSMYIDLADDSTSSLNISEISEDAVHATISYSEWRMMIVNMIGQDDQKLFLERTDPEYLKKNFIPGRTSSFDCLMMNLEGKYIWVKLIFSRAQTTNEDDYRFVFMVQNIHEDSVKLFDELKKYEELALTDALTEVYNHGRVETEIRNALDSRKKYDKKVSTLILDIDHFKNVNDTFGHSVGDNILKHFASLVKDYVKDDGAVVGRWGGEEFVVVYYDLDFAEVQNKAEGLRDSIENTDFPGVGKVTCSIGLTEMTKADSVESAFERMDKAMYNAKSEGRNCVRFL